MTTVELKAKTGTLVDSEYISASRQSAALSLEAGLTAACFYCHTPNDGSNSALQPECTKQQVDGPDNLPVKTRSSSRIARKPPAVPAAAAAILPKQLKPAPRQTARKSIKVHRTSQHAVLEGPEAKQTVGTSKVFTKAVASEQIPLAQAVPSISYVNHKTATTEITQAANCLQSGNGQAVTKTDKVPKQQSNKRKRAETVAVEVPQIELGIEYTYKPGQEPYRAIQLEVNETELRDPALVDEVARTIFKYNEAYRKAKLLEDERWEQGQGKGPDGKALSRRPDTLARKMMEEKKQTINADAGAGHVPGICIGDRFYLRAQMGVLGLHFAPVGGIDLVKQKALPPGCPVFATSVMVCGGYEDDADNGDELTYTGQGGNDLLGNRKQTGHQELVRGNLALVNNIRLRVPVRVTRRNEDLESLYGCTYIYDGLYSVTRYWKEVGLSGMQVYKYHLQRRPNQGQLVTQRVVFGGVGAPKSHSALATHGLVDRDLSGGLESVPVIAVNEFGQEIPAFTDVQRIPQPKDMKGGSVCISDSTRAEHRKTVDYLVSSTLVEGLQQPDPPELPAKWYGNPHGYLKYLNGGRLPYFDRGGGGTKHSGKRKHSVSTDIQPVIYECGPWACCPLGINCPQAATQQGLQYRLEVFMTPKKGWGVRSWDTIPHGAYVVEYTGEILPAGNSTDDDQDYTFNLAPRPQRKGEEVDLPLLPPRRKALYKLDAKHEGNVSRLFNHSCQPNLYVQPVLSTHHDHTLTKVCFFAWGNIPPLTELTFDYGEEFVKTNLDGKCQCGSTSCVSTAH